jgi:hypothetical protein
MKAVVCYDDFTLAANAKVMLEHAALEARAAAKWNVRPWRLDMLNHKAVADEALADAVRADLVLVVTADTCAAPGCLQDWLDSWVVCRRVSDAALGLLCASPSAASWWLRASAPPPGCR